MRTRNMARASALLACVALVGCASGPRVHYGDPTAVEVVTIDFGSTDLQSIAQAMVNDLLASPALSRSEQPVLYVAQVKNKTDEHVDTKNITDKIRTSLLRSGRVRFTASAEMGDELLDQLEYQADSGIVRPDSAKRLGQQIGADYFLFGELTSIRKRAGRVSDLYMKFTLNLVVIESGLIEWADEKEIRKGEKRPVFGR